ncbi:Hypothetical predicted protein, partial [Pelobates cultripes]
TESAIIRITHGPNTLQTAPRRPPSIRLHNMGGGKKRKEELTPSVASMFRTPGESQRPTHSYQGADQGTDSEGPDPTLDPSTPLTIGSLRDMLKEATVDIKSHVAEEITRNLAGLRTEIQTLTARTDQTE